jgi:hypothetical protein
MRNVIPSTRLRGNRFFDLQAIVRVPILPSHEQAQEPFGVGMIYKLVAVVAVASYRNRAGDVAN